MNETTPHDEAPPSTTAQNTSISPAHINITGEADVPEDLEGYLDFLDTWQINPVLAEVIVGCREHAPTTWS